MAETFLQSVTVYEDHVVVVFNASGGAGGNVSTSLRIVDFTHLRSNRPVVFWPFIVFRLPLQR